MPRGQFVTVFTLGFATAIALFGVVAGVTLLFWHEPYWRVVWALDGYVNWLSPLYFSLFIAGTALFVAYWIVRVQQSIVGWAADRMIAKLSREYGDVARRHGKDKADEFIAQRALGLFELQQYDLFGRDELARAMAAAGVHASRKVYWAHPNCHRCHLRLSAQPKLGLHVRDFPPEKR